MSVEAESPAAVERRRHHGAATLISFVIPVRDDAGRLGRCLRSIGANQFPIERVEIIVVDNGSRDGSADIARAFGARVIESTATSVSALRNIGAREAHGAILAFVDADHEVSVDWIHTAVDVLAEANVGAAGDLYHGVSDGTWVQRAYDGFRTRVTSRQNADWVAGGNFAIRRRVFDEIGGFDTSLSACEDVDLCCRLRAREYRVVRDPALYTVHWGDPATARALFRGELWRGRDNVRVTVRDLSWRSLPSVVIPIIDLACLAVVVLGLVSIRETGFTASLVAAMVFVAFTLARAVRITGRRNDQRGADITSAFVVALVYDAARALALVLRRGHHRVPLRPAGSWRGGVHG